jgi:hypothetical protein
MRSFRCRRAGLVLGGMNKWIAYDVDAPFVVSDETWMCALGGSRTVGGKMAIPRDSGKSSSKALNSESIQGFNVPSILEGKSSNVKACIR